MVSLRTHKLLNRACIHITLACVLLVLSGPAFAVSRLSIQSNTLETVTGQHAVAANNLSLELSDITPVSLRFKSKLDAFAFTDVQAGIFAENISLHGAGSIKADRAGVHFNDLVLNANKGELLTPYAYSSLSDRPVNIRVSGLNISNSQSWITGQVSVNDGQLQLTGNNLKGSFARLDRGNIHVKAADLKKIYDFYLLPVISSNLAMVELSGGFELGLVVEDEQLQGYELLINALNVKHKNAHGPPKYAFENVNAKVGYAAGSDYPGLLRFDHAAFLDKIAFGSTQMPLRSDNSSIQLAESVELPVFDGSLLVDAFSIKQKNEKLDIDFQGVLTPVSLGELTKVLDWPQMQGKISGVIPGIRYSDGNARLAGTMLVKVFDGDVLIKDVQASHLLSSWPVLKADVHMRKINLEPLTRTFSFGRISGLLDGRVSGLVMENWSATAFDASFQTSPDSDNNRISQKAVDNISNLGGAGMAGALSRTFLRFFEDFGYASLGLNCVLVNGICQMSGVEKAQQGYYLVKGKGIPRIDVIGYNESTDWNILVDRLSAISQSAAPTIN